MSSSHKARVNGGGASAGRRTAGGSSQSKPNQRKEAAAAVSVSHTIDDDYTETLEKQITKEKASKADTNASGAAKKKKKHFKAGTPTQPAQSQ